MTQSMTAFAREERSTVSGDIVWEVRSVNHRFLEAQFRLPENTRHIEAELRASLKKRVARGKLDCTLQIHPVSSAAAFDLDEVLLERLNLALQRIAGQTSAIEPVSAFDLLRWPGVLREPDVDKASRDQHVLETFVCALEKLRDARRREGAELANLLRSRSDRIEALVRDLREHLPALREAQERRIRQRIEDLDAAVDQQRLEQELVYLTNRSDVDEELDRLGAHLAEVRRALSGDKPCGRHLDFLMQELNREANTLGAKASGLVVANAAIDIKVLIEQMREQVQNIE